MKIMAVVPLALLVAAPAFAQTHKKTAAEYEADAARYEAQADALLAKANAQGNAQTPAAPAAPVHRATTTVPVAPAAGAAGFLRNGTYNCIAGFRVMLTLGTMTLSGNHYRFHPPQGADTTGTFTPTGNGIRWSGDVGIIKNGEIVASDRDQGTRTDDFWLTFANDLTRGEQVSLNCKL